MKTYGVEVEDSDGADSFWEVRAASESEARRKARALHWESAGYHDWRDDDSACPAIVRTAITN